MKFISASALTALLGFAACLYGPWWSFAITTAIVAIAIHMQSFRAFASGFTGLFILWFAQALWIDNENNHLLSEKVASILPLGGSTMALIFVTAFIGALVAGFAALTGSLARTTFFKK